MISKRYCKNCGRQVSIFEENNYYANFRRYGITSRNSYSDLQYTCPFCGIINNISNPNSYNGNFELSGKAILISGVKCIFGWLTFSFSTAMLSISNPADYNGMSPAYRQQFANSSLSFVLEYCMFSIILGIINILLLIFLVKDRYDLDTRSRSDLMPFGQSSTMLQSLVVCILLNVGFAYFIMPLLKPSDLTITQSADKIVLWAIMGALASSWSHRAFFKACRAY